MCHRLALKCQIHSFKKIVSFIYKQFCCRYCLLSIPAIFLYASLSHRNQSQSASFFTSIRAGVAMELRPGQCVLNRNLLLLFSPSSFSWSGSQGILVDAASLRCHQAMVPVLDDLSLYLQSYETNKFPSVWFTHCN